MSTLCGVCKEDPCTCHELVTPSATLATLYRKAKAIGILVHRNEYGI